MYQAHRQRRPGAAAIALRVAGHFVAALFALVAIWAGLVGFLLAASAIGA